MSNKNIVTLSEVKKTYVEIYFSQNKGFYGSYNYLYVDDISKDNVEKLLLSLNMTDTLCPDIQKDEYCEGFYYHISFNDKRDKIDIYFTRLLCSEYKKIISGTKLLQVIDLVNYYELIEFLHKYYPYNDMGKKFISSL